MPVCIDNDLPARKKLESDNIFVMDRERSTNQEIRPLKILIVNLMPLKEDTEVALLRCLSNTPLQCEVYFVRMQSHDSKNTSESHLERFYITFDDIKKRRYDGMIITGAPVETLPFEEVDYWDELTQIMDWADENVTSTLHVCWGAQAGLYYHYGVEKFLLPEKLSGIYKHHTLHKKCPLVRGFDDIFYVPHSRYTGVNREEVLSISDLEVVAESDKAGPYLILDKSNRNIFVTGHPEYDQYALDKEYKRDLAKGINPAIPENYYPNDDPRRVPLKNWRCHANTLYSNWLNYYVYQETPYEW